MDEYDVLEPKEKKSLPKAIEIAMMIIMIACMFGIACLLLGFIAYACNWIWIQV